MTRLSYLVFFCSVMYNRDMEKYELNISVKRRKDLIEAVLRGVPIKYALDLAFLDESRLYHWRKSLEEYKAKLESGEETDRSVLEVPVDKDDNLVYEKLNTLTISIVLTHARASCLDEYLQNLKDDPEHYQRWSWLLERTFRKEFGKDVVEETPNKTIDKIQVVYVEKDQDKDRLEKLEKEVKESLSIEDGNTN